MAFADDTQLFLVNGCSMVPVLRPGDRVDLHPIERPAIQLGDILVFSAGGKRIIHRVISLDPLQTQGDNRATPDAPIKELSSLQKAVAYCRNGPMIPLTCGAAGMKEYRKNQRRRKIVSWLKALFRPIVSLNPFKIPFNRLTPCVFRDKTVYYAGKRPVGWKDKKGWHWMRYARFYVQHPEFPEEE